MAYRIEFKNQARKQFAELPSEIQRRMKKKIDSLALNPRPRYAKKLSGEEGIYRVRAGDYRVLYQIRDDVLIILIIKIAHRRDAYRD